MHPAEGPSCLFQLLWPQESLGRWLRLPSLCLCLHGAAPLCLSLSSPASNNDTCHWIWGHPDSPGLSHLEILSLITSVKSLFPDKVTFTATGGEDSDTCVPGPHRA